MKSKPFCCLLLIISLGYGKSNIFGMEMAPPVGLQQVPLLPGAFAQLPPDIQQQLVINFLLFTPLEQLAKVSRDAYQFVKYYRETILTSFLEHIIGTIRQMTPYNVTELVHRLRKELEQAGRYKREAARTKFMDEYAQEFGRYIFSQDAVRTLMPPDWTTPGWKITTTYFDGRRTISLYPQGKPPTRPQVLDLANVNFSQMNFDEFLTWFKDRMLNSLYQQREVSR